MQSSLREKAEIRLPQTKHANGQVNPAPHLSAHISVRWVSKMHVNNRQCQTKCLWMLS